ncbi:MAG: ATP-dependent Clp protease ATP-binding subunit [Tissierellia bacterium]|nr:ATP-dependent Clp protease ATP-binding subunit [Tissierellia bacterium]
MENNRLTNILQQAKREAYSLNHDYVGLEHILLSLMKTGSIATKALEYSGANYELFRSVIIKNIGKGTAVTAPTVYNDKVKKILDKSRLIAGKRREEYVGEEHVLLAILEDSDSFANIMFMLTGVEKIAVRENLLKLLKDKNEKNQEKKLGEILSKFAKNLNEMSKDEKIDPVIERDKEIERVIQILMRRTKNNPILIGEPGVGKTAIVEGLAQKIVEDDVPDIIKDKLILSLDLPQMLAGTKYRGDFEDRLKKMVDELSKRDDIILFIDEFHMVLGAGAAEGSMDAANILKPVLARGEIQIIGATTTDEYRKQIEKDQALARRLQSVTVDEPDVDVAIKIINGIKEKYEKHHDVKIPQEAVNASVELSKRYITDRFLPDKAIDLIDEACSKLRIKNYDVSNEENDPQIDLDNLIKEKEIAVNEQDFEKAAKLRDDINRLKSEVEKYKKENKEKNQLSISYEDIANIVSDWSKVPVTKLTESELLKYKNLDKDLKKEVIGQDEAIDSVSHAVKRARVGIKDPRKPIGSFIFVGPTGVGKTYLAKSLAKNLFGDEDHLIRIDMSEYMEKFSTSRLVGSPPGYVGYEEGGELTEAVRKNPYSVILFDEIEKAHPDVFNILLQILDDGRLTDGQARTVDFKNTIIIMTSNVGASSVGKSASIGFSIEDFEKQVEDNNKNIINSEMKRTFTPEFLNRLDEVIMFNALSEENINKITTLMLDKMVDRLKKLGIEIKYNKRVVNFLADKGFNKEYGARPLERTITKYIENQLAEEILDEKIKKDMLINLTIKEGKINFSNKKHKKIQKDKVLTK